MWTCSFSDLLPFSWVFVPYTSILRMVEGLGTGILSTTTFSLLPDLFPNSISTAMVGTKRHGMLFLPIGGGGGGGHIIYLAGSSWYYDGKILSNNLLPSYGYMWYMPDSISGRSQYRFIGTRWQNKHS